MSNTVNSTSLNSGVLETLVHRNKVVGNHTISYEVLGGSIEPERTMVLMHGAFSTRNATKVLAKELAKVRPADRIIMVDAPWHGDSETELSIDGADVNTYAEVLAGFVNGLKGDGIIQGKLAWFGWSMGGSIGMLLDLQGVQIDELVLVNSSPVWEALEAVATQVPALADPATSREVFNSVMMEDFKAGVTDEERDQIFDNFDSIIVSGDVMVNDLKALEVSAYDIREQLPNIKAKTLIFSTQDDMLAKVDMQEEMGKYIPDSVTHLQTTGSHSALMKPNDAEVIASCFVEVFTY